VTPASTPTTASTGKPSTKQTIQPSPTTTRTTAGPTVPDINAHARKQESGAVGRGAIAGIIIGTMLFVLLIGFLLWLVKKKKLPSRAFYQKKGDTVQFSNDAYTGSSMSFDNVLFDNLEADPVLMQPLDFPIDDKQPLPQDDALEHLDYDNPLYHGMMGLDASQTSSDPFFKLDPSQTSSEEGIKEFANPMYDGISGAQKTDFKVTMDSSDLLGGEDTC